MYTPSNISDVEKFHTKFDVPVLLKPGFLKDLHPEAQAFREKFLQEELDEFKESCAAGDLATAYDSLLDLVYVAAGTALMMGCNPAMWQEMFDAVQKANMSKVRATSSGESKRGTSLDVVKPAGWVSPDVAHKAIIEKYSA